MAQEFYLLLLARDGCGILFDKAAMRTNEGGHQVREPGSGIPETITPTLWSASLTGEVTHISSRVREFSGLTLEDFVNFGWRRFIHPDDFEDIGGASRRTCGACAPTPARIGHTERGFLVSIVQNRPIVCCETRFIRAGVSLR